MANFTQESKVGRQLMAKCRSLADENEEMGRELAEGKVGHKLRLATQWAHPHAASVVLDIGVIWHDLVALAAVILHILLLHGHGSFCRMPRRNRI